MRKTAWVWVIGWALLLGGCEQPSRNRPEPEKRDGEAPEPAPALAKWYRERVTSQRETLRLRARTFREAIRGMLDEPDAQRLATARETWRGLHEAFNRAWLALRLSSRSNSGLDERLRRTDPLPIFPGYVDGLRQWPDSGIVHDPTVELTRTALIEQHGATARSEASLGFQVIRFLLHGEPDPPRKAVSFRVPPPGKETSAELPDGAAGKSASLPEHTGQPAGNEQASAMHDGERSRREVERRRKYLRVATRVLTRDLRTLATTKGPAPTPSVLMVELRSLVQRLIRLEGLADADEVAGEYMAPATRQQAMAVLRESLEGWLAPDTPFMRLLGERAGSTAALRERVYAIQEPGDMKALQALDAELAAMGDRLGRKRVSK